MLPLNDLCWLPGRISLRPLSTLESSHNLKTGARKVLERYYSLHTVGMFSGSHTEMLHETLSTLVNENLNIAKGRGYLVYAKTQTHNTFFDDCWLDEIAARCGIGHWEKLTISLNHCASALSAIHLLKNRVIKSQLPMILITGEKAFHCDINKLDNSVMAEIPAAMLLNAGHSPWQIKQTAVRHLSSFYNNHREFPAARRRELFSSLEQDYYDFYLYVLDKFSLTIDHIDAIVPGNIDLPMLRRIADKLNFKGELFTEHISGYGHAYCSDILFNLSSLLKSFEGKRILCVAMGMGITMSCILIEKNENNEVNHVTTSVSR
ncbi:3-oxoacyl-[acyl-carrier-protein] synthase III C-terminal domain-containing protein (plasmid) [Rahnella aceris]|uniref:3-oxoacyl-[acyl-carrier-protein] synthase III C-terminal domain-containing protein n=1 Tax=Rahnella sp. (strain Y9602) TaxID=2703885 RepID=UPI001422DB11|nr:3-oxoacyl-[acyl-carrier-protein] synthase III C-terminal domain-containing protein [Rahnella aceris]NIA90134.1 3-oxoacyl-ACP synthase [Rahnella aceris]